MATPTIDYQKLADDARKVSGSVDYAALANQARSGGATVPGLRGTPLPGPPKAPLPAQLNPDATDDDGIPTPTPGMTASQRAISHNPYSQSVGRQVGSGVVQMSAPGAGNKVAGLNKVLRGAELAALPMVGGATSVPPVVTGLAAGFVGGKATRAGAKALGASDEVADLVENVGGAVAGGTAAHFTPNSIPNPLRVDPYIGTTRSLRPVPSDPGFNDRLEPTLRDILAANGGTNPAGNRNPFSRAGVTKGKLDVIAASQKSVDEGRAVYQQWLDRAAHVRISGNPIVQATAKAAADFLPSESGSVDALVNRAAQDYGMDFTPEELNARLELINKRLNGHFEKNPSKQSAALADIPDAVLKRQAEAIRDTLYRALDPQGNGAGPREVQLRTGDRIDIKNAGSRRNNAIVAEQPLTPFGQIADPIKGFVRSMIPGKATGAGIAYAEGSEGRSLPLLRRSFEAVRNQQVDPLPKPDGLYPTGLSDRLLGQGDIITPPPPDTSSVRSVNGMAQPPDARRAIAPGRGTIITPPPPDTSGVNTTTGPPLRAPLSRQLPASRTAPPLSDVRGGPAGDITDLVPSIDPVSGKVEYIPRPKRGNPLSDRLLYEDNNK